MEFFNPSNLVMIFFFKNEIFLKTISETLTCVFVEKSIDYYINKKIKIPFLGINNIIISIRFDLKSRGLRIGGKQLRNTVAIDLQIDNKNIHIKITKYKMHITGCLNEEMGIKAFNLAIDHIKMCNDNMLHIKNLDFNIKNQTIEWIYRNFKNEDDSLKMYDTLSFDNLPSNIDYTFCKYISMFTYDCKIYINFIKKINILMDIIDNSNSLNICYNTLPIFLKYYICNSIYTYSLNYKISLIKLAIFLKQNNYEISYHNWHKSKSLDLFIPILSTDFSSLSTSEESYSDCDDNDNIEDDSDCEEDGESCTYDNKKKRIGHRFKISQNGSVRQNSPSYKKEAYDIMILLKTLFFNNIDKIKK